jgi:hypothetical protein
VSNQIEQDGLRGFAKRIVAFFNQPAVYVLTLIALGIIMLIGAAAVDESWHRTAKVLNLGGATVLGAGVFTAVTKAFLYGGVFRSAVMDALQSDDFRSQLEAVVSASRTTSPPIQNFDRRFDQAVDSLLAPKRVVESLDILAHTSSKYLAAIRNRAVHVKHVRLLLIGDQGLNAAATPKTSRDKETVRSEVRITAGKWQLVRDQGVIERIDIRACDFASSIHFMLIDRREAQFGIFRLIDSAPGVTTLSNFVVHHDGTAGSQLVADFQSMFDDIFSNRSQPWVP